jgi:putative peptidoglycan lipid II flippase
VARAGWLARPRVRLADPSVRELLRAYAPLVAGATLLGLTPVCDRAIAASAGAGAVATLGYAGRLVDAALAIGATAIGTAMLPFAAQSVALGRRRELRRTVHGLVALLFAVSVPVTCVLVLASEPITAALFERGAFTPADTRAVAAVQAVLALQIPIYLVGIVAARLLAAHRLVRVLFVGNALSLVLTLGLDLLLVGPFGAAGIAAATVIMRTVATLFVVIVCLRSVLAREADDA